MQSSFLYHVSSPDPSRIIHSSEFGHFLLLQPFSVKSLLFPLWEGGGGGGVKTTKRVWRVFVICWKDLKQQIAVERIRNEDQTKNG